MCLMFALWGQIYWKSWFWKIWVEFKCFWKSFRLILKHLFFIKQCALRSFCIKMLCFSKTDFSRFSINRTCCSIDQNCNKNFGLTKFFFMHHLCLGFTCIALFLYPSYSFAVISLIVFAHNMHTLCYIGYSTWSKID